MASAVSLTSSTCMQRKIHGHLFYYCDIPGRAHWCQHSLLLFASASAVRRLLSSELFLTLALRVDHCLLAAGSERMNKNEFMRMLQRQYISIASFFVIKSKNLHHFPPNSIYHTLLATLTFNLFVGLPSNSHLAAYIEALFSIQECYVLNFFFWGRGPLAQLATEAK